MRLSYETVAICAFVLAIVSLGVVGIESLFDSSEVHLALATDKKCKVDTIDESLCVIGIPDPDFNDK